MILQESQLLLPLGPEVSLIIDATKIVPNTDKGDKKELKNGMTVVAKENAILSVNFCNSTEDVHNIKHLPRFINMK